MAIQSFLKVSKGDPDWAFTPEQYFDKEFKIIDASLIELSPGKVDEVVLRQSPTERELLAKHIRIDVREGANLDLTIINESASTLQQVFIYEIRLREGSQLSMGMFVKGGALNKHIIEVTADEGSIFYSYGYIANKAGGDSEIITKVNQTGNFCCTDQFFAAEAGNGGQTVLQNVVKIDSSTAYTSSRIENLNLITDRDSRCYSIPEIYNETSSARISASTKTDFIDLDRTYYLQTRGFTKDEAENVIKQAHKQEILNLIELKDIYEEIEQFCC